MACLRSISPNITAKKGSYKSYDIVRAKSQLANRVDESRPVLEFTEEEREPDAPLGPLTLEGMIK